MLFIQSQKTFYNLDQLVSTKYIQGQQEIIEEIVDDITGQRQRIGTGKNVSESTLTLTFCEGVSFTIEKEEADKAWSQMYRYLHICG